MVRVVHSYISCTVATLVTAWGLWYFLTAVWEGSVETSSLWIFIIAYCAFGLSITVGNHRHGVHRSFQFTVVGNWTVRLLLRIAASLSVQNTFWFWITAHKMHHADADGDGDPHSPAAGGLKGFLWAHMMWVPHFRDLNWKPYCQWKNMDWFERLITRLYLPLIITPPIILFFIAGWQGLAAYLAAIFLFWHVTGSINSVGHTFGDRPNKTGDMSTNIWWWPLCLLLWLLALLSFGESWHNEHHRAQSSAKLGRKWYQLDPGWWLICLLRVCGLVHSVRVPR